MYFRRFFVIMLYISITSNVDPRQKDAPTHLFFEKMRSTIDSLAMEKTDEWLQMFCYNFTYMCWYSDIVNKIPVVISFLNDAIHIFLFSDDGNAPFSENSSIDHTDFHKCFRQSCWTLLLNHSRTSGNNRLYSSFKQMNLSNLNGECCKTNVADVVRWLHQLPKDQHFSEDALDKIRLHMFSGRKKLKYQKSGTETNGLSMNFKKIVKRLRRAEHHSTSPSPATIKVNNTKNDDQKMYEALSLSHSKDPLWALVSVFCLLGAMVLAGWCLKMRVLPKDDVIHVHYSQNDWTQLLPVQEILRGKARFLPKPVIQHRELLLSQSNPNIQELNINTISHIEQETDLDEEEDDIYSADAYTRLIR